MSKANKRNEKSKWYHSPFFWPTVVLLLLSPLLLPFAGIAFIMVNWAYRDIPRYGEHLPTASEYSSEATNYSYYNRLLHRVCEFDLSEDAFVKMYRNKFVAPNEEDSSENSLHEIETLPDLPLKITRYNYAKPEHEACQHFIFPGCDVDPSGETDASCFRAVSQGYCSERRGSDGGGIDILYDTENGRCYIRSNPR